MNHNLNITASCRIRDGKVYLNNKEVFNGESSEDFPAFIKSAYQNLGLKYGKFHKMDSLSKLGFIASEYIFSEMDVGSLDKENTAIVLANSSSSLDTDIRHHNSIKDASNFYPSPAVFVYTLPNIVMGEICIKNKIQGENAFFIFDEFNAQTLIEPIEILFEETETKACLGGWVEFLEGKYEAFLFFIEKESNKGKLAFNVPNMNQLYL